ncbi:MAG: glycosyltransferase [Acidimicrobiales bacterium]
MGRVVEAVAPKGPVLDIGGSDGLTAQCLPGRPVIAVDIRPSASQVIASGAQLPFADRSFAVAVALDVLEHLPDELKVMLVVEAARVADVVVLAGPFADRAVEEAERHQRDLFAALFGHDHPWLIEHYECGLPHLETVVRQLEKLGFETHVFGSNPLQLWEAALENTHMAIKVGFDDRTRDVRRWLAKSFLAEADNTPPSYRQILTASREPGAAARAATVVPGQGTALVREALDRMSISTAHVVAQGWQTLSDLRTTAVEEWAKTAELVRNMERNASACSAERAVLEDFAAGSAEWRSTVSGPPTILNAPAHTLPDHEEYGRWRESRQHPKVGSGPLISILTPVYNPSAEHLTSCIRSVRGQTYDKWELILLDASTEPHVAAICQRFHAVDGKIRHLRQENAGIAGNTNAAAAAAAGAWFIFLDHDDTLEPHALAAVAAQIEADPGVEFIYSDEDKIDSDNRYVEPFFKPGWSPDLLRCVNYLAHLIAVRRELFERCDGLRTGFDAAQDYDFVLRATAESALIAHIPDVLYHWRQHAHSTAADVSVKPDAHNAGARAVRDIVHKEAPTAIVIPGAGRTTHRVRYPITSRLVSIVIPFKDKSDFTERCLSSLAAHGADCPFEVLLVSNQSKEPATFAAMEQWTRTWPWARLLDFDEPYNFQRLNNWAAQRAEGDLLLFLNNDTEVLHRGWIEALAEFAQRPSTGAAGARLFYPDGTIQHAGVAVGIGGFAEHPWAHLHPDAWTPTGPSYWVRNVLAVTAACLMIERAKFDQIGGFDERFIVCGGDVDLGLRLFEAGYWNVVTPYARLVHHEAATRDREPPQNDVAESLRAYAPYLERGDPFYNPNLTLADTSCRIRVVDRNE